MTRKRGRIAKILVGVLIASFLLVGCGTQPSGDANGDGGASGDTISPDTLIWGSASMGAAGYIIIEALTATLNRSGLDFRNSSISTQGSMENLILLSQKEIQLGQTTSSDLFLAYNGTEPFKEKVEFNQVMSYAYWALPVAVAEDSPITKIEELDGKKVSMGPAGGATVALWQAVFAEYGIEVEPVYLSWQESADALKMNQIDALITGHVGPVRPMPAFQELAMTKPYRFLDADPEKIKAASKKNAGIILTECTAHEKPVNCPGYSGVLVADPNLDEEVVYTICKTLYEKEADVQAIAKELEFFRKDFATEMIIPDYPIHKGAAKYYKEQGMWQDHFVEAE